jgi:hypothetical protein
MESDLSLSRIKTFLVMSAGLFFLAIPGASAQEYRDSLGKQLSPTSAAIVKANQAAEKDLNLVARVEVRPDEILEFYEPAPGRLLISGAGAAKSMSLPDKRSQSPADVWRRATAGAEMPAALREALDRVGKRQRARSYTTPKTPGKWGGGSPSRDFTRAAGYCDDAYYTEWGGCGQGWDYMVCLTNWWDGVYAYHHDAEDTLTHVCPASGRVAFRMSSNEFEGGLWTVDQHHLRYAHYIQAGCAGSPIDDCPYVRADVEQATGVRFHFEFLVVAE